jgi:hypothetical protein
MTTPARPLGDPVPPALAGYYADLDADRFDAAADRFAVDAVYAVPRAAAIETDPRAEHVGRTALAAYFQERGPRPFHHEVLLCAYEGGSCLVEGVSRHTDTGIAFATFVASVQIDDAEQVRRYLAYACVPPVDPAPSGGGDDAPADAGKVLHDYFAALDDGAFEEAAAQFSLDVVYSHPPYRHTGIDSPDRVVFRGRDELLANFRARGRTSFDHTIVASLQRGPHCLIEGLVEGLPHGGTGSFVSSLTLDGDGLIQRYASFYCEPGVRRW